MKDNTENLTLAELAHCQAACQVIGTALMSMMATASTKHARVFFSSLVNNLVETNSEAVATLEAVLLANDGELCKRLELNFTVTF